MSDGVLLANAGYLDVKIDLDALKQKAVQNYEARRVMNQSLCVQMICTREMIENGEAYEAGVHGVPDELGREVAESKLAAEGIETDSVARLSESTWKAEATKREPVWDGG